MSETPTGSQCQCFWTDPKDWYVYYGAVEPGSQMERNPDCPVHGDGRDRDADVAEWLDQTEGD